MATILQIDKQRLTGQAMRTLSEAVGISKRGHRVILACQPGTALEKGAREHSLEVLTLDMGRFFPSLAKLSSFLRRERVDLINAHGYRDHLLSLCAGRIAGVKVLVRTKHNHKPLKGGAFSRFIYSRLTDKVVAISNHTRNVLIESGLKPGHVDAIYTAIDLKYFSPRTKNKQLLEEFNISNTYPIIGTVARLSDRKGISFLIDAVKLLVDEGRKVTCFIVGGGGSSSRDKIDLLKKRAASMDISHCFIFTGLRTDIPEILSLFDVFILPSLAEGLGRSLVEAMAAGKPVVASKVGGIPEAVEDGKTGILVPPGDAASLARALAFLFDNPQAVDEMGYAGRKRAEMMFDEEKMVDAICLLYEELLDHPSGKQMVNITPTPFD